MFVSPGDRAGRGVSLAPSGPYVAPPPLATFTWANQGSATAQQSAGRYNNPIQIHVPDNASLNWRLLQKPIPYAAPYSLTVCWRSIQFNANSQDTGLYFYDGTKLIGIEFLTQGSGSNTLRVEKLNSLTSDNSTAASLPNFSGGPTDGEFWGRLRNDGQKLYFDFSKDGSNWTNMYNENVGTFIAPTKWGIGGISVVNNAAYFVEFYLMSWQEQNSW